MSALKRIEEKLPANVRPAVALEAGCYVQWHQERGWHCVTDKLPTVGDVVYAYGYWWDVDADNLNSFMYRCSLGEDGLWTYRPTFSDGRNNDKIFEPHQIDFWRTIPEEKK